MKREPQRPVTLEDLLRLKRAERPADDFWSEFDRQLRAKQLAALVEKRPWWRSVSLAAFLASLRRFQLPLGATAVLAVSYVAYRGNYAVHSIPVVEPASGELVQFMAPAIEEASGRVEEGAAQQVSADLPQRVSSPSSALPQAEVEQSAATPRHDGLSVLPPRFAAGLEDSSPASFSGSTLSADSNWSAGVVIEPVASRSLLATSTRFEARTFPTRPAVEPLKQITPPAERRGARILTAMVSMASVESAMRATERAASRLSEEELYEQIRRVGAFGAGVNVKF